MLKTIKRIVFSALSILGISFFLWTILLLNPNLSYANQTQIDMVTVYHNQDLSEHAENVIHEALAIIRRSTLFDDDISIQLCLNDDKLYPNLHPLAGQPLAYALFNKTTIKNCQIDFQENVARAQWSINNNELRKFDLTWLLAHEFTHNLQYGANRNYVIKSTMGKINWKLEGHAEYIARDFKNDERLSEKIEKYLEEVKKDHVGFPVFELEDGTKQILSYYKYALAVQYLIEVKNLDFQHICALESSLEEVFSEMIEWKEN